MSDGVKGGCNEAMMWSYHFPCIMLSIFISSGCVNMNWWDLTRVMLVEFGSPTFLIKANRVWWHMMNMTSDNIGYSTTHDMSPNTNSSYTRTHFDTCYSRWGFKWLHHAWLENETQHCLDSSRFCSGMECGFNTWRQGGWSHKLVGMMQGHDVCDVYLCSLDSLSKRDVSVLLLLSIYAFLLQWRENGLVISKNP